MDLENAVANGIVSHLFQCVISEDQVAGGLRQVSGGRCPVSGGLRPVSGGRCPPLQDFRRDGRGGDVVAAAQGIGDLQLAAAVGIDGDGAVIAVV